MSSRRHDRSVQPAAPKLAASLLRVGAALALLSATSMAFEVVLTHLYSEIFNTISHFWPFPLPFLGWGLVRPSASGCRPRQSTSSAPG